MPDNKPTLLRISRLLTPKHRADLLTWVHVANTAENSVRKSFGLTILADSSSQKSQKYFCEKSTQRRKK